MTYLYYPPTQNGIQKTLDSQLNNGDTSSMSLNNVTGVQNQPGVCVINRIDSDGNEKSASDREFIIYSGTSGNTLTGLTRGVAGSTDQDHVVGSIVEFIPDITWAQGVIDFLKAEHTEADGTHSVSSMITGGSVLDEDDMASDSATALATQQSVKAYIDTYKAVSVQICDNSTALETGDGQAILNIPTFLNGAVLKTVHANVDTAPVGAAISIQIHNATDSVDMLSTALTIDDGETGSDTAATAAVIDTGNDDVATNDRIRIDIDAVGSSTASDGLIVRLEFAHA